MKKKEKLVQLRVQAQTAHLIAFACREQSFRSSERALDARIAGNMTISAELSYEAHKLREISEFIPKAITAQGLE